MRANSFNTGIASEYLVLSKLYRLELEAYVSQGNKKSVDIRVIRDDDTPVSIDVKSVRGYSSLVVNNVEPKANHFVVFVIYNNKFSELHIEPDIYVVPSIEVPSITQAFKKEKRVMKGALGEYKEKWEYIQFGYGEDAWTLGEEEEKWIDFVNCHAEIKNGAKIGDTLLKYKIQPHNFLTLQSKLSNEQHIGQNQFDSYVFKKYDNGQLKKLLNTIRNQNIKGATQMFGDKIENELKERSTNA